MATKRKKSTSVYISKSTYRKLIQIQKNWTTQADGGPKVKPTLTNVVDTLANTVIRIER